MFVLLIVLSLLAIAATIYWTVRYEAALPALWQEWAKANHLVVLRKVRAILPTRLRLKLPYRASAQSYMCLEVLDESSQHIGRVWLLIPPHFHMTCDDIVVLGWDEDR